ncbi:hypothetical protein RRG08_040012 [Elysia crispata]|uniref:Uncharacterized protein n=1 Tax=Elysia crispata TaxID=231223 RepID=A0AAE1DBI1_9GAST|nr:hypothetical protein RRG08_040012 [Elysia crispata]
MHNTCIFKLTRVHYRGSDGVKCHLTAMLIDECVTNSNCANAIPADWFHNAGSQPVECGHRRAEDKPGNTTTVGEIKAVRGSSQADDRLSCHNSSRNRADFAHSAGMICSENTVQNKNSALHHHVLRTLWAKHHPCPENIVGKASPCPENIVGKAPPCPENIVGKAPPCPENIVGKAPSCPENIVGKAPPCPENIVGKAPSCPENIVGKTPPCPENIVGKASPMS